MTNYASWPILVVALILPQPVNAQDCGASSETAILATKLTEAEQAFTTLDIDGFDKAMDDVTLLIPCLSESISPSLSARFHRMQALRMYTANTANDDIMPALRAAKALDPTYAFPDSILPSNHDFRVAYRSLDVSKHRTKKVPWPREYQLFFDGIPTRARPLEQPTLLQMASQEGAHVQTFLLRPNDPLPDYRALPRLRNHLLLGSAGAALLASALYGTALFTERRFWSNEADLTNTDLASLKKRSATLFWLSVGVGAGAVGSSGAALAVGER